MKKRNYVGPSLPVSSLAPGVPGPEHLHERTAGINQKHSRTHSENTTRLMNSV